MLKIYFMRIYTPYHVGWRNPRKIIDHTTLLRALISLAYETGYTKLVEQISNGVIKASAILPTVKGDRYRLLVPIPPIPSKIKIRKYNIHWITLEALHELIEKINECPRHDSLPFISSIENDKLVITCISRDGSEEKILELTFLKRRHREGIINTSILDLRSKIVDEDVDIFYQVEYHNRIDRITGSADPYVLTGYKVNNILWFAVRSGEESEALDKLLQIHSEIGLGGYRSRGWGHFRIIMENIEVDYNDYNILLNNTIWKKESYNVLLGSMIFNDEIDYGKSFININEIEGKAGPTYNEYDLPVLQVADIGSLVYLLREPGHLVIDVTGTPHGFNPKIVFNPLVISA